MGNTSYSFESRKLRAASSGYATRGIDDTFHQNKLKLIHATMDPKGVVFREARDSSTHPHSVPIILALDVTGSMRGIPHHLIKTGLPKMMAGIIQKGQPDPAVLFIAIGDHQVDTAPLQIGQFESGDLELDTWLTRTWLEGGGGANAGESYLLSWYFAAKHTKTDAWDKRHEKGFLFTTGDEPGLESLPKNVIQEIMGDAAQAQGTYTDKELLAMAQEHWNVYHLHVTETSAGFSQHSQNYWKDLLGQNCIMVEDSNKIPDIIAEIVVNNGPTPTSVSSDGQATKPEDVVPPKVRL
jgi:hypothetical protein